MQDYFCPYPYRNLFCGYHSYFGTDRAFLFYMGIHLFTEFFRCSCFLRICEHDFYCSWSICKRKDSYRTHPLTFHCPVIVIILIPAGCRLPQYRQIAVSECFCLFFIRSRIQKFHKLCLLQTADIFYRHKLPCSVIPNTSGSFANQPVNPILHLFYYGKIQVVMVKPCPFPYLQCRRLKLPSPYRRLRRMRDHIPLPRLPYQILPVCRICKNLFQQILQCNIRQIKLDCRRSQRVINNGPFPLVHRVRDTV